MKEERTGARKVRTKQGEQKCPESEEKTAQPKVVSSERSGKSLSLLSN